MGIKISKEEALALLQKISYIKRDDLKMYLWDDTDYYLLDNGKILIDLKSGANHSLLLDSELEYLKEFINFSKEVHSYILKGFPCTEDAFYKLIPESKKKLQKLLKLNSLDYTFDSLKKIDKAFLYTGVSYDFYFKYLFFWLVPYASQCVINESKGKWELKYNKVENTIEPFVNLPNGRCINLFIDLNEEALEDFANFSVYSTAQIRLEAL